MSSRAPDVATVAKGQGYIVAWELDFEGRQVPVPTFPHEQPRTASSQVFVSLDIPDAEDRADARRNWKDYLNEARLRVYSYDGFGNPRIGRPDHSAVSPSEAQTIARILRDVKSGSESLSGYTLGKPLSRDVGVEIATFLEPRIETAAELAGESFEVSVARVEEGLRSQREKPPLPRA